jgi:Cu2+-exporting ATPase
VLEALNTIDTVVFDKTGTLTQGQPAVTGCQLLQAEVSEFPDTPLGEQELLQLAAAVEQGTQHPLAIALQRAAQDLPLLAATDFHTEPGLGAVATVTWQGRAPADLDRQ